MCRKLNRWISLLAILLPFTTRLALPAAGFTNNFEPGVAVTFATLNRAAGNENDGAVVPGFALFVPNDQAPTPFLAAGPFKAVFTAVVAAELRGEYRFQAQLNGHLRLAINGAAVLDATTNDASTAVSQPVRLNKGANSISAEFTSPAIGPALLQVLWIPKGGWAIPLPTSALSHDANNSEIVAAQERTHGRALFLEYRCAACHQNSNSPALIPEAEMEAASFDEIGSRVHEAWLAEWILDPRGHRTSARMPKLFYTPEARADAEAAAAFLSSLKSTDRSSLPELGDDERDNGQRLFDELHCVACHDAPQAAEAAPNRIALRHVAQKFAGGALTRFLEKPEAHNPWSRMPNFGLRKEQATALAAFLLHAADKPTAPARTVPSDAIAHGKRLVQTRGCLNCHRLALENEFKAKSLADLPTTWERGCLAPTAEQRGNAPAYALTEVERQALQRFASADRQRLTRHVPSEFAQRQVQNLNCRECHGKFDGFPGLDLLGEKLKPEWSKALLAGELPYKPRSWLTARMPSFPRFASGLAEGLANLAGYPSVTPPEPPIPPEMTKAGQKLISADGGLSCVSCHAVGPFAATQVFDNAGINFAFVHERLHKPFFLRWVRNPLAVDPVSKMPVFFDEEMRSPLLDIFDGNGDQQLDAIWQYLSLGRTLPPPPGLQELP